MPTFDDNVDQFVLHPMYALAVVLPDREHVDRMIQALSAGLDADSQVQVIHGEEGLRILDPHGNGHGLSAWFHRLLQNWTYYEQILDLYSEALTHGEFMAVIPCAPDERRRIATTAVSHGAHSLYYFGYESVESLGGAGLTST